MVLLQALVLLPELLLHVLLLQLVLSALQHKSSVRVAHWASGRTAG